MRRFPKGKILGRWVSLLLSAAAVWGVLAVAGGAIPLPAAALSERAVAAALLEGALGRRETEPWIAGPAALAMSQSPLLLGGREAVLELRRAEEQTEDQTGSAELPRRPVTETPAEPQTAPQGAAEPQPDNGVPARTLLPGGTADYLIAGLAYVNNTSVRDLSVEELTGDYARAGEGEPQVLILHTHGSEAYTMPPGQEYEPTSEYRTSDTAYNVVRVGDEIAARLAERGLSVIHDRTLYDYPEYSGAYGRAMESIESYLERYPSIRFVLDIHRDAITDSEGNHYKVVAAAAEGRAAQLSLVMGSDGGGSDHPRWKENLRLAVAVQNRLLEETPELMRPITLRNSHYNQMSCPGHLLVEMGAAGNSLDEALISARLFAEGFADVALGVS